MTLYDLIYQSTAQIKIEDCYRRQFGCSKCGKPVKLEDIRCPHCGSWFISEKEINDMTEQLIKSVAEVLIRNIRGE